jgi:hypothetical protein
LGSYAEIGVSYQTLWSFRVSETVHRRIITKNIDDAPMFLHNQKIGFSMSKAMYMSKV